MAMNGVDGRMFIDMILPELTIKNHLPQIPWLAKYGKIKDLSQSNMTKLIQDKDKQLLFATVTEAIPIYLSKR